MAGAFGKGLAAAAAAAAVSLLVTFEGFAFSLWALDRKAGCQAATELCDLNAIGAAIRGTVFGFEALVGTAIAGVLLALGRVHAARIAACSLVALLALGHVWLLV